MIKYSALDFLKGMLNEDELEEYSETTLETTLARAGEMILNRLLPYGRNADMEVPKMYWSDQAEIAKTMIGRFGIEGQDSHSEGGINRNLTPWGTILDRIQPLGKITSTGRSQSCYRILDDKKIKPC